MNTLDCLQGTYSDTFKDVYGFRPRNCTDEAWNSKKWLQQEIETLAIKLDIQIKEEQLLEQQAILKFEKQVESVIATGAGTRETAIRWIFEAEDNEYKKYDRDYFCYCNGLPYGYFKDIQFN